MYGGGVINVESPKHRRLFWCVRTWPYRPKVWTFSKIKPVYSKVWFTKKVTSGQEKVKLYYDYEDDPLCPSRYTIYFYLWRCGSGSALIFPPGSGSAGGKTFQIKNWKNASKLSNCQIGNNCIFLNFTSKFAQALLFLMYFWAIFCEFFQLK